MFETLALLALLAFSGVLGAFHRHFGVRRGVSTDKITGQGSARLLFRRLQVWWSARLSFPEARRRIPAGERTYDIASYSLWHPAELAYREWDWARSLEYQRCHNEGVRPKQRNRLGVLGHQGEYSDRSIVQNILQDWSLAESIPYVFAFLVCR